VYADPYTLAPHAIILHVHLALPDGSSEFIMVYVGTQQSCICTLT
jgi:hypothetical protein